MVTQETRFFADPANWEVDPIASTATMAAHDRNDDIVLSWLRGDDVSEPGFTPVDIVEESEDVNMEPMVITVSRKHRETLLRRAGWKEVNIQFLVRDFNNESISGYVSYLMMSGPGLESNDASAPIESGIARYISIWVKPNAVLRFFAVPMVGTPAFGRMSIEGPAALPDKISTQHLIFTATQENEVIQVSAANLQQVNEQMQASGNVKFSILGPGVGMEIGGGGSTTRGSAQARTDTIGFSVRVGRPTFTIAQAER
jgi:hypothetical protein